MDRLEHQAIIPFYDCWHDSDGAFLVMRWLRGGNLRESLQKEPWSLAQVTHLVDQLAGGYATAHMLGVVHRNIKPANILLNQKGNGYLSYFTFARYPTATVNRHL